MPYLVFATRQAEELGRRRLDAAMSIGRSSECEVALQDNLLSRRHCRLLPAAEGWVLSDLGSRNGTCVRGHKVSRHVLRDGDVFQIGRINVIYRVAEMRTGDEHEPGISRPKRPATPAAASEGTTVAAFKFQPPPVTSRNADAFPTPIPIEADLDWLDLGNELHLGDK